MIVDGKCNLCETVIELKLDDPTFAHGDGRRFSTCPACLGARGVDGRIDHHVACVANRTMRFTKHDSMMRLGTIVTVPRKDLYAMHGREHDTFGIEVGRLWRDGGP